MRNRVGLFSSWHDPAAERSTISPTRHEHDPTSQHHSKVSSSHCITKPHASGITSRCTNRSNSMALGRAKSLVALCRNDGECAGDQKHSLPGLSLLHLAALVLVVQFVVQRALRRSVHPVGGALSLKDSAVVDNREEHGREPELADSKWKYCDRCVSPSIARHLPRVPP